MQESQRKETTKETKVTKLANIWNKIFATFLIPIPIRHISITSRVGIITIYYVGVMILKVSLFFFDTKTILN